MKKRKKRKKKKKTFAFLEIYSEVRYNLPVYLQIFYGIFHLNCLFSYFLFVPIGVQSFIFILRGFKKVGS